MAEYIEREAFVNVIDREIAQCHSEFISSELKYLKAIIPMYLVKVEGQKHGKWKQDCDGDWYCTHCDQYSCICESGKEQTYQKPFCPNCGAKMHGGAANANDHETP